MTQILIDAITNLSFQNGLLRVECMAIGPDGKQQPSGTLLIPGAMAGAVMQALNNGTQQLDKRLRELQQQGAPASPTG